MNVAEMLAPLVVYPTFFVMAGRFVADWMWKTTVEYLIWSDDISDEQTLQILTSMNQVV